jgi:tRNA-splicing ligase RtcB (3'-phosphate/5'-hydroxy nucleic acid ligase)
MKPEYERWSEPPGKLRVPGNLYASEQLIRDMDLKVYEQDVNVATLPRIQKAFLESAYGRLRVRSRSDLE